jgi:hypothetical protein
LTEEVGTAAESGADLARESLAWQRYGPFWYRVRKFVVAAGYLGGGYLVLLVLTTLLSLYPGDGTIGSQGPPDRAVRATVRACDRVGPVSGQGLGYWWICDVAVRADGRADTHGVVTRSIATPDEIGRTIDLRERCSDERNTACVYGEPASQWWGLYLGVLVILKRLVGLMVLVLVILEVALGIVGAPRYVGYLERRKRRKRAGG